MGETRQYEDEKLSIGADLVNFSFVRINAPKKMEKDDMLLDDLTYVTRKGFGTNMEREDVKAHIFEPHVLYVVYANHKRAGFAAFEHYQKNDKNVLFLEGIVFDPKYQGQGLFGRVVEKELEESNADVFTLRTQNPAVYRATQQLNQTKQIYPDHNEVPGSVRKFAEELTSMKYNLPLAEDFVMRNVYGKCLYNTLPECTSTPFFNEKLKMNYDKGDSVLIISEVK